MVFIMELNYEAIGKRIRKLRKEKKWSQEDLRYRANISKTHMSHIETGTTKLSLPTLVDIANALETTPDHILRDNVTCASPVSSNEINEIIDGCNNIELQAMIDAMLLVKRIMRSTSNEEEI